MVVRTAAAPPTPWSKTLAEPQIDDSAYVHSFSNLIGDVHVEGNVLIAPGTSIRADEGNPFHIGEGTNIQDGVVIHGLEKGRVVGDNDQEYSVWIGKQACITHMALIHGPAYVGDGCFIGFRSTVFNARIGQGCIVMMHALIQDVEIPPGKYIPSGAVITNQQQADRLPEVTDSDRHFAHHVVEVNEALRVGYQCADNNACIAPIRQQLKKSINDVNQTNYRNSVTSMSLSSDIVAQVRSLLSQGYTIGAEHASKRRFRTKSWLTGETFSGRADQVLEELENFLQQYQGEYVRLLGVDAQAKRRVLEVIIQRPEDTPGKPTHLTTTKRKMSNGHPQTASNRQGKIAMDDDIASQVCALLNQGYKVGAEHASQRRFRTKSWLTGETFSGRADQVLEELKSFLKEHQGEYVRLLGVDAQAKRRVLEVIIQRPEDTPGEPTRITTTKRKMSNGHPQTASNGNGKIDMGDDIASQVRALLHQGYKVGTEFASQRRFRTKSWLTGPAIDSQRESEVMRKLQKVLAEHDQEYVRLIGIDPNARRRVLQTIIHRPGDSSSHQSNGSVASPRMGKNNASHSSSGGLTPDVIARVRALLSQGYKIGTEHADKRRFRTKSWQSCSPIDTKRESEVIAALEACLVEHQGEYVRLLGIDKQAKQRVSQTIIQRPGQASRIGADVAAATATTATSTPYSYSGNGNGNGSVRVSHLSAATVGQVRSLLSQGYKIGTEHADKRRFRTKSWQSCSPIDSKRESEVIAALEGCLAEHAGEYVRLIGIDAHAKRRVLETIIQRP